jgi:hypothetical protein
LTKQQEHKSMKQVLVSSVLMVVGGLALAKLPVADAAAMAKAAEAAAKRTWQAKVDGYKLCKAQDKIAALYKKTGGSAAARPLMAVAAASVASQPATGTPVAAAPPAPCIEPGPFAYNPPQQKPLESSGAHSPTGTAASPPSVKETSSQMAPARKP